MIFGLHLSVAGGLAKAARLAGDWGLDCLQIFSGNPRGWKQRPFKPNEPESFRRATDRAGLSPVVVHAPYLINLASPKDDLWHKSVAAMAEQLCRARLLGARAVVVHPGSRGDEEAAWGIGRVSQAVRLALAEAGPEVEVWLENTCGGGGHLGGPLEQLGELRLALAGQPVGFCLDTAHAWGAGYDLAGKKAVKAFLARVDDVLGLEHVRLWHLNDSVHGLGSHRDQHTHLGKGAIGRTGFRTLARDSRLARAPGVMETPKDSPWADRRNLALMRRLSQ